MDFGWRGGSILKQQSLGTKEMDPCHRAVPEAEAAKIQPSASYLFLLLPSRLHPLASNASTTSPILLQRPATGW